MGNSFMKKYSFTVILVISGVFVLYMYNFNTVTQLAKNLDVIIPY